MEEKRTILGNTLFVIPILDFSRSILLSSGLNTQPPYRGEKSIVIRAIREIHFRLKLPFRRIWYYPVDRSYSHFFIFDGISADYIEWLHKKYPQSNYILFYMNKCQTYDSPDKYPFEFLSMWSGDEIDCQLWPVLRKPPVGCSFGRSWVVKKDVPSYDILFVGKDKGRKRLPVLLDLEKKFKDMGLNPFFYITSSHRYGRFMSKKYKRSISYEKCLDLLGKTKAILYLGFGSQKCVTIRVQESIVHKIKLITDCTWIKQYDFYNPHNIFILGEDNLKDLPTFLNEPYVEVKTKYLDNIYFDDNAYSIIKASLKNDK